MPARDWMLVGALVATSWTCQSISGVDDLTFVDDDSGAGASAGKSGAGGGAGGDAGGGAGGVSSAGAGGATGGSGGNGGSSGLGTAGASGTGGSGPVDCAEYVFGLSVTGAGCHALEAGQASSVSECAEKGIGDVIAACAEAWCVDPTACTPGAPIGEVSHAKLCAKCP